MKLVRGAGLATARHQRKGIVIAWHPPRQLTAILIFMRSAQTH